MSGEKSSEGGGNGKWRVDLSVALRILAFIIAGLAAYGVISARVSVVETKVDVQQTENERRLERIEHKLDQLLERR